MSEIVDDLCPQITINSMLYSSLTQPCVVLQQCSSPLSISVDSLYQVVPFTLQIAPFQHS